MATHHKVPSFLCQFARDESGVLSVYNLFLTIAVCAIGSAGLDVTHFYAASTQLQVAADIGAHAALYTRQHGRNEAQAKAAAVSAVSYGMPASSFGTVLEQADITFGTWNNTTRSFTALASGSTTMPSAARVMTNRAGDNPVGSFLFRIVGIDRMDVRASTISSTYYPPCLSEGFTALGVVDIQSNNSFFKGFCMHSNTHVEMNQNNYFELGTIVSMPDQTDIVIPASGMTKNEGLEQALRSGTYNMKELDLLRPTAALEDGVLPYETAISTLGHAQTPSFLTSATAVTLAPGSYAPSSFTPGRVHRITCGGSSSSGSRSSRLLAPDSDIVLVGNGNGNGGGNGSSGQLTLSGGTYSRAVIVTDCLVNLGQGTILEDVVLYTSNTSDNSITASSSLTLGRDDHCAAGGGATLLTRGGMHAAAKMVMFGAQVRLLGDFEFASGGNAGVTGEGVSVMAGGRIDGTTHMDISACSQGMNQSFETAFFRMAE